MKKTLLAGLMMAGLAVSAQTPRLSLFEEFTGETCNPCAATNPGLNTILASPTNTPKVVAIKWQVPIPSAPTPTWSLYKTNQAEIDWRWKSAASGNYGYPAQYSPTNTVSDGINSAPTGLFDGQHAWNFGAASDHPYYVTNAVIATAQSYTSAFSVTMQRAWDATFSSVNLTVNITASAAFAPVGTLIFRTVMVEKEIHFATQPGTNGEKDFYDAAIKSFPSLQAGTPLTPGNWTLGQTQSFTLNCPVPSYARDKAQIAFVGFIQDDGDKKVAQAVRSNPVPINNDAKAESATAPMITCANSMIPQVTIKNNGPNALTAFDVNPYMNGTSGTTFNWTGNLAPGATTVITLASMNIVQGSNTFSYNITNVAGTDYNTLNNAASVKFIGVVNYQGTPVAEGFGGTFPPTNWSTYNNYDGTTWAKVTTTGGFQTSSECTKLDLYTGVPAGSVNELMLPPMSFTGSGVPTMSFDVAYAQYTTSDDDLLEVMASSDCGANWTTVYSKSGTNGLPTTAPVNPSAFTPNSASQWRRETVTLTGFNGMSGVLVKFVGTSDYGNNMYIDNVNLSQCLSQNISISSSKPTLCVGEKAVLTATGATTFSWSGNQTTNTISVNPTSNTTYTVYSNDANSCKDAAVFTQTVSNCTGILSAETNVASVNLYPNPTSGISNLNISLVQNGKVNVTVVNSIGQLMYTRAQNMNAGDNSVILNTENWANGVYFINIATGTGSFSQKLTVSK